MCASMYDNTLNPYRTIICYYEHWQTLKAYGKVMPIAALCIRKGEKCENKNEIEKLRLPKGLLYRI